MNKKNEIRLIGFLYIVLILNIIFCAKIIAIESEYYSLDCSSHGSIYYYANDKKNGYMHNSGAYRFFIKTTNWELFRIFEKYPQGSHSGWMKNDKLTNQYFCLERGVEITPASDIDEVYPSKSDNLVDGTYIELKLSEYAAIGRILYEYINKGFCDDKTYFTTQSTIHEFINFIGKGEPVINEEIDNDAYNAAYDDFKYFAYDNSKINISSGLTFTLSGDKYISNVLNITIPKADGASSYYTKEYSYELKINNTTKASGILGADKKVQFNASDLNKNTNNNIELIITASRDFYMPIHYSTKARKSENEWDYFQDLVATEVKKETKKLTKNISITLAPDTNVKIRKITANRNYIYGTAKFKLYNGLNCNDYNYLEDITVRNSNYDLSLIPGEQYSLKEITPPEGYSIGKNACTNFSVKNEGTTYVYIENYSNCVNDIFSLMDASKLNKTEIINLYKQYGYTNLLNFTLITNLGDWEGAISDSDELKKRAAQLCSNAVCDSPKLECLSATSSIEFDQNNLSCFNNKIDYNGKTAYCYLDFVFGSELNKINIEGNTIIGSNTKAGQFISNTNNGSNVIGRAALSNTCYFLDASDDPDGSVLNKSNYDDYISGVNFMGITAKTNPELIIIKSDKDKYSGTVSVDYVAPDVYVKKISGKNCTAPTDPSCVNIGTGLISNFYDAFKTADYKSINGKNYMPIRFSISFSSNILTSTYGLSYDYCYYELEPEIITYDKNEKGELQLEFRTIDTNNPFNRNTNANWCDNGDCSSKNETVSTYIKNRNNSYNRTGNGPIYRIKLTPSLIKKIREYNAAEERTYDNYELDCDEKGCSNAFLKEFNIIKK